MRRGAFGPVLRTRKCNRQVQNYAIGMGPQTFRVDISNHCFGLNRDAFPLAPPAGDLNLCNLHTFANAEHMSPGFRIFRRCSMMKVDCACND